MRDLKLFDVAVARFFEPIARKINLPMVQVGLGLYEIPSPHFIMRIRLDTGHSRGLNVILRKASLFAFVDNKPGIQLGIGCFRLFYGENAKPCPDVITDAGFLEQAKWFAIESEWSGVPYLLGLKDDFDAVQEFMNEKAELRISEIKQMMRNIEHNMPKVRMEWPVVIPRESTQAGETAKELYGFHFQFLGSQQGKKEQLFMDRLFKLFNCERAVKAAYLVRVIGFGLPAAAALAMLMQSGSDKSIIQTIGRIFADCFDIDENLNLIFLTDIQLPLIQKVCRPFFGGNEN